MKKVNTLVCPGCDEPLKNLDIGTGTSKIALECHGTCGKKWLVVNVLEKEFLLELHDTRIVQITAPEESKIIVPDMIWKAND